MERMKLTNDHMTVINLLRNGWGLGKSSTMELYWMEEGGLESGGQTIVPSPKIIRALFDKCVIKRNDIGFELTELGKIVEQESYAGRKINPVGMTQAQGRIIAQMRKGARFWCGTRLIWTETIIGLKNYITKKTLYKLQDNGFIEQVAPPEGQKELEYVLTDLGKTVNLLTQ